MLTVVTLLSLFSKKRQGTDYFQILATGHYPGRFYIQAIHSTIGGW
ncbi:MAG: hypothetical protein SGI98_01130 [Verrucomicrobiota bacterium]|nr:hypothetical protein [Verrucomicrobiota bacterium]